MNNKITDRSHPYWRGLYVRLSDGLNSYGCNSSVEITKRILTSLPNVDVDGTLAYFREEKAAYCDCGVYFHVFSDEPELKKAE